MISDLIYIYQLALRWKNRGGKHAGREQRDSQASSGPPCNCQLSVESLSISPYKFPRRTKPIRMCVCAG